MTSGNKPLALSAIRARVDPTNQKWTTPNGRKINRRSGDGKRGSISRALESRF